MTNTEGHQEAAVLDAPVAVRELEWVDCTMANEKGEPIFERLDLRAQSGIGNYYISYDHFTDRSAPIALSTPTSSRTGFATEDQAKAAAQVHFKAAIRSALIPAKPAVEVVEALDDDQIMEVIKECFPWRTEPQMNDMLTYEKSPPLFPQATYDVPSYRATKFVRAVEARLRAALQAPATPDAQTEVEK